MSIPYISPGELHAFINGENPTTCPVCGSRTLFIEQHGRQLHQCMNADCQIIFISEDEATEVGDD